MKKSISTKSRSRRMITKTKNSMIDLKEAFLAMLSEMTNQGERMLIQRIFAH